MQRFSLFGSGVLFIWPANIFDLASSQKWNVFVAKKDFFYFTGLHFELKKIYTFKVEP